VDLDAGMPDEERLGNQPRHFTREASNGDFGNGRHDMYSVAGVSVVSMKVSLANEKRVEVM
jgi:hypothetical protein